MPLKLQLPEGALFQHVVGKQGWKCLEDGSDLARVVVIVISFLFILGTEGRMHPVQ